MRGWIILGAVLLAFLLLGQIRLGALARYGAEGLLAQVKVGFFRLTIYPIREKAPKKEKKKREKKKPKEEPPKGTPPPEHTGPGGKVELVLRYLPLVAEAVGRFKRKVRIDRLYLDFISASPDPAAAAMAFGGANVALGMILPLFEHNFRVKERRVRTAVDFQGDKPTIFIHAELSLTIGQLLMLGLRLLIKFLSITLRARAAKKTEKEAV